jgi:hypothetical protein
MEQVQQYLIIVNIENYISSFKWDDSRFPRNNNVTEIVKIIQNVNVLQ